MVSKYNINLRNCLYTRIILIDYVSVVFSRNVTKSLMYFCSDILRYPYSRAQKTNTKKTSSYVIFILVQ